MAEVEVAGVLLVAVCAQLCSKPAGEGGRSPSEVEPRASGPAQAEAMRLGPCRELADVPRLESYAASQVAGSYWVDVVHGGGEWRPAEPIDMPHHHASRLELVNIAEFRGLDAHRERRLRLVIEIVSSEITKVPDREQWRATHTARVKDVCLPEGAERRGPGGREAGSEPDR